MTTADDIETLADLLDDFPLTMAVTLDDDGHPLSQPLAMQQQHHRFDGDLWFLISAESSTAKRLEKHQVVNLAFSSNDSWVSVTGHAELTTERSYIDEMWDQSAEAWFPGGSTDPSIRALIVHTDSAEYWDTPGSTIATVLSLVKSKVTGTPIEIDNEKIDL
ncbi:pyridoxamine 5'-phosphate oxidase family protein [Herbiconiux sp. KACC 21604]|uniref:pyridoxamine 5'-phosphate oxidase family protein n=1 Tax=unclassified Herbiconiux TaxID=2618217 RepID=UPI001491DE8B|nr:pyridoxamine 5'-phosphate oxidase family protein [Herbiconiux sp. SALV-R1]QJU52661.1 pyridoxamine 5'-phosphate oxidase family protein [Herbiconiux sp. SALV-R1]WPO87556.1 pyridoxamine 5'-phosphate oxidase family protein [Herbiconiux sp. KACC 21604]